MFKSKQRPSDTLVEEQQGTLIGSQTTIKGDITFSGFLSIKGRVQGEVRAEDNANEKGVLYVEENGQLDGAVFAPIVQISGQLTGDVHATEMVELLATARVEGDIHYRVVQMNAGAQFSGRLIHSDGPKIALPSPDNQE